MPTRSSRFVRSSTKFATFSGLGAVTVLVLSTHPTASALMNIAQGKLDLQTTLAATYDSRIVGSVSSQGDHYFSLSPSLLFSRDAGRITFNSSLGVDVIRYLDNTQLDSENLRASLRFNMPEITGRLSGQASFTYDEQQRLDTYELLRISEETFGVNASFELPTGPRTSVGASTSYSMNKTDILSDQEILQFRTHASYSDFFGGATLTAEYSYTDTASENNATGRTSLDETAQSATLSARRPIIGKLVGSGTIGYRMYDRSRDVTSVWGDTGDGLIYSVSIQGPFLPPSLFPKLESSASISYQNSETPGLNDSGQRSLTGSMSLAWQARERTSVRLTVQRSQSLTRGDLSVVDTTTDLSVTQTLIRKLQLQASIGFSDQSYDNIERSDELLYGSVSAGYSFASRWSASLSYRLESRDGNESARSFDRTLISANLSARF